MNELDVHRGYFKTQRRDDLLSLTAEVAKLERFGRALPLYRGVCLVNGVTYDFWETENYTIIKKKPVRLSRWKRFLLRLLG